MPRRSRSFQSFLRINKDKTEKSDEAVRVNNKELTPAPVQYEVYPSHTGYYTNDIYGSGEEWLRNGYANWNGMATEEMNAAMALAVYLQSKKATAVLETFWTMSDDWTGPAGAIESVTGKPFADFYLEFAKAYWSRSFEPVKSWNWISREAPVVMSLPVNPVFHELSRHSVPAS